MEAGLRSEGFEGGLEDALINDGRDGLKKPMGTSKDSRGVRGRRSRIDDPHLAFAFEKEVAKEHAQWWRPRMKEQWNAADASALDWTDAVISAWAEDQCNKTLGQELTAGAKRTQGAQFRETEDRELGDWREFKVSRATKKGEAV